MLNKLKTTIINKAYKENKNICIIGDGILVSVLEDLISKQRCLYENESTWEYRPALYVEFHNKGKIMIIDCADSFRGLKNLKYVNHIDELIVLENNPVYMEFILTKNILPILNDKTTHIQRIGA